MEETRKLYDNDPYARAFTAEIISAEKSGKDWEIVLDQTLFFPEEGGQSPDTGILTIGPEEAGKGLAYQVKDVQIRNGVIYHRIGTPSAAPCPGMKVRGEIDWAGRFSNMQNHTGEHIISGLIHAKYGFDNVGFHLSENIVTLDQSGYLAPEQIDEIERAANLVVWRNLPVTAEYFSQEEAKQKTYRSKIEIEGEIRLVTIGCDEAEAGIVDVCACCAPHVARTGEVGLIKILRSEKYKGGMRLTILCGERALEEVCKRQKQIERISHLLRAKQDETFEAVQHLYDENAMQKERLIRLQEEKIRHLAEMKRMPFSGAEKGDADQVVQMGRNIWIFTSDLDPLPHRNLVNLLVEKCDGFVGVFLRQNGSDGNERGLNEPGNSKKPEEYRFIIGSRTEDSRRASGILKEALGAKGGGKPEMVQGSVLAECRQNILTALGQL